MPIRKSERARYPADWKQISNRIRFERAEGKCECTTECGVGHLDGEDNPAACGAPHGEWIIRSKVEPWDWALMPRPLSAGQKPVKVVLTVAHLDHTPENCDDSNLLAMCQRCHLVYDGELRRNNARETRRKARACGDLPGLERAEHKGGAQRTGGDHG